MANIITNIRIQQVETLHKEGMGEKTAVSSCS